MQNVSRAYKESMRGRIRNRGYIRASIGIVNPEAQKKAQADPERNNFLYISDTAAPFSGGAVEDIYATPEQGFARLDGTRYFMPPEGQGYPYYNNGLVTADIMDSIYIDFGGEAFDIKGLTIDFGDCYPTDFTIETDSVTREYAGNNRQRWTTEDTFDGAEYLKVSPLVMVNGEGRLRIYRFSCGVTNTFTNDDVMGYSEKEYISPIAETVPSMDISLTVKNYDMYYSPDNPDSALAYMEAGQDVRASFGYDVDGSGSIEWLPERKAYLKTWKADEAQAEFTATDVFDYIAGTYYRGAYHPEGISLYDLAVDVFDAAGVTDYYIDSYLRTVMVNNPMPAVAIPAALQIIANAGRCILKEERSGRIRIQSSFIPEMEATANNEASCSHVGDVLKNDVKDGYANTSRDYSVLDGSILFYPFKNVYLYDTPHQAKYSLGVEGGLLCCSYVEEAEEGSIIIPYPIDEIPEDALLYDASGGALYSLGTENGALYYEIAEGASLDAQVATGYISESVWMGYDGAAVPNRLTFRLGNEPKAFPAGGYWDGDTPVVTITLEASYTAFGLAVKFRNTAPKEFCVSTYLGDELVDYLVVRNPDIDYYTDKEFADFDRMEISFTKGYPGSRIFVDNILIGDNTDYELSRDNELITAPVATRQSKVQDISVSFSLYKESTEMVSVASEEITVPEDGYEYTAYFSNPSYGLVAFVDAGGDGGIFAEIVESSCHYAVVRFTGVEAVTTVRYSISGYEYAVEEQKYTANYNKNGEIKTWNNPLVSTAEHAKQLEEWLAVYFLGDVEYEIDWKGDPAVDANDLFHLETKVGKAYIRDYENSLSFNGRWTGGMKARKVAK